MPQRTYVGPHDEVELAATGQVVRRGESVDVDAALAEQLDAQDTWAKPTTKAAKSTETPPDPPAEVDPVTHDGQPITKEI